MPTESKYIKHTYILSCKSHRTNSKLAPEPILLFTGLTVRCIYLIYIYIYICIYIYIYTYIYIYILAFDI